MGQYQKPQQAPDALIQKRRVHRCGGIHRNTCLQRDLHGFETVSYTHLGVGIGSDDTLFALVDGRVHFERPYRFFYCLTVQRLRSRPMRSK